MYVFECFRSYEVMLLRKPFLCSRSGDFIIAEFSLSVPLLARAREIFCFRAQFFSVKKGGGTKGRGWIEKHRRECFCWLLRSSPLSRNCTVKARLTYIIKAPRLINTLIANLFRRLDSTLATLLSLSASPPFKALSSHCNLSLSKKKSCASLFSRLSMFLFEQSASSPPPPPAPEHTYNLPTYLLEFF